AGDARLDLWLDDAAERLPDPAAAAQRDGWLAAGLLRAWPDPAVLPPGLLPPTALDTRPWLAGAALLLLLGLVARERFGSPGSRPEE
ncbi:MAG TPA: hypothetical protein VIW02_07725, partial [Gammaproteobacteria bacterium]